MSLSISKGLSVSKVAKQIGIPVKRWPGACYLIASKMVEHKLVKGVPRYGHWLGPVAKGTMFSNRIIVQHGWIECVDRIIAGNDALVVIDPTRFVFENKKPYIYVGPKSQYYDIGGNQFRDALRRGEPFPDFVDDEKSLPVPLKLNPVFGSLKIKPPKRLCVSQLFWLANKPYYDFGGYADILYKWLIKNNYGALIPYDNQQLILGSKR